MSGTIEKLDSNYGYCNICDNSNETVKLSNDEYGEDYRYIVICKNCLKEALEILENK